MMRFTVAYKCTYVLGLNEMDYFLIYSAIVYMYVPELSSIIYKCINVP